MVEDETISVRISQADFDVLKSLQRPCLDEISDVLAAMLNALDRRRATLRDKTTS